MLSEVSPKLFGVNSWIPQMIRQWIPDSWSGDRKCTGLKGTAANSRNWQLMTSGRSQVLATSNFTDWHTVVGEIPWSSVPKTTINCHSKLVLHSLRNNQPVQVIVHQPRQTTLIFPGLSDQTCCSIWNVLQLVRDFLRRGRQNRVTVVDAWCDKGPRNDYMYVCGVKGTAILAIRWLALRTHLDLPAS